MISKRKYSYQATDHSSHIEDSPEPSKVATLLVFVWIRDHDSTLGSPQQTGANTQKCSREDIKAWYVLVDRNEQANCINAVANAAKREGNLYTELVDKSTAKEGKYSEGAIECCILYYKIVSLPLLETKILKSVTMLSASVGSAFPPPPIPLRALNMPGQRKQTKETITN